MAYNYDIEYRKSADHANADALSRLPRSAKDKTGEENSIFYFSVVDDLPLHTRDIAHSARKDPVLSKVREFTLNGWPDSLSEEAASDSPVALLEVARSRLAESAHRLL